MSTTKKYDLEVCDHQAMMKSLFPLTNHSLYGTVEKFEDLEYLTPLKLSDYTNDNAFDENDTTLEICPTCFFNTSGTTNRSKRIPFSDADLMRQRMHEAIALSKLGMREGHGVMSLGAPLPSISGWAIVNGSDALGATAINTSQVDYDTIFDMHKEGDVNVVIGTPLVVKEIGLAIEQEYGSLKKVFPNMEIAIIFGDVLPDNMRAFIKNLWGIDKVYSLYGTVEADVVATECPDQPGLMQLMSERLYFEFISEAEILKEKSIPGYQPKSTPVDSVMNGDIGEIVISDFSRESLPLLRYRIGDVIQVNRSPVDGMLQISVLGRSKNAAPVGDTYLYEMQLDRAIQKTFGERVVEWRLVEGESSSHRYQLCLNLQPGLEIQAADKNALCNYIANSRSTLSVPDVVASIDFVQVSNFGEVVALGDAKAKRIVLA